MHNDITMLNKAMHELESMGYLILTGETCCSGCAYGFFESKYGKLPDDLERAVYYTEQDLENLDTNGDMVSSFYLKWAGNAEEIITVVRKHGLLTNHNGQEDTTIEVFPLLYSMNRRASDIAYYDEMSDWEDDYED